MKHPIPPPLRSKLACAAVAAMLLLGPTSFGAPAKTNVLMPVPAGVAWTDARLPITTTLTATVRGPQDTRVNDAVARMLKLWEDRTGFQFPRTPAGQFAAPDGNATLVIEFTAAAAPIPTPRENETYTLETTANQATLRSATSIGALRGIATLTQLLQSDASGWFLPAGRIEDSPRFAWRGLLIDPSRHWIPLEVLKRNIDAMALVKLNVLHFHLTEDQGWRIESKKFPQLQQLGSDGNYFTQDQIRDLIAYAAARGIRIVPEFDLPGHATTWAVAFPELASAPGPYLINRKWGVHDVVLDPTNEKLYSVLDDFLGEMAALFPDEYVHIGGDENNGKQWKANAKIQEFIQKNNLKDNAGLQAYFNRRLMPIVTKHGKKMIGWDEILHRDLPAGTVIHSWRGANDIAAATGMGFATILSRGYYLDHMLPAAQHYANDPIPADTKMTPEQQQLVMGGEACMWGEWATAETFDSRTWPRAAAVAERLWSPRSTTDVDDMYRRLAIVNHRLEESGLLQTRNLESIMRRFEGDTITAAGRAQLHAFAELFESGTLRVRAAAVKQPSQFTPLTELADCIGGDSMPVRGFAADVRAALFAADRQPALLPTLASTLKSWSELGAQIAANQVAPASPRVVALAPLGRSLADLTQIGLAALQDIAKGGSSMEVAQQRLKDVARLGQPQSGVTLPIAAPIRTLVAAAALEAKRSQLGAQEWSTEVERLAAPPAARR